MSDLKDDFLAALTADTPDNLKRQLQSANLMVTAMMDTLGVTEVKLTRKSLTMTDGGLETYYDFESDGYIVVRTKPKGGVTQTNAKA